MFFYVVKIQAQAATLSERILESYNSAAMLQAHGAVPGATRLFEKDSESIYDLALSVERIRAWLLPLVQVVGSLCIVLLLTYGAKRLEAEAVTIGQIAAFAVYIGILGTGLTSLGWLVNSVQRGWVALTRVNEILDARDPRPEVSAELPPAGHEGTSLEVRGLTFQHAAAERPALEGLCLRVNPGETVGIFGLTGSGKTTLLNAISRIYDPPPGTVFVDGRDILEATPESLWRRLAYVTQRPYLFSESIRANVVLGGADDEAELARAEGERDAQQLLLRETLGDVCKPDRHHVDKEDAQEDARKLVALVPERANAVVPEAPRFTLAEDDDVQNVPAPEAHVRHQERGGARRDCGAAVRALATVTISEGSGRRRAAERLHENADARGEGKDPGEEGVEVGPDAVDDAALVVVAVEGTLKYSKWVVLIDYRVVPPRI